MIRIVLVFVFITVIMSTNCSTDDFTSHRYGVKSVTNINGKTIYFKREVGIRYDRTALSFSGDRCQGPNDDTDYVLSSLGAGEYPLHFSITNNEMSVYEDVNKPKKMVWPIKIIESPTDSRGLSVWETKIRTSRFQ